MMASPFVEDLEDMAEKVSESWVSNGEKARLGAAARRVLNQVEDPN